MPNRTAVGVDIGGTYTKIALVRSDGQVLRQEKLRTGSHGGVDEYVDRLEGRLADFVRTSPSPLGIGLALPGFPSENLRSIAFNPNTPALVGLDFIDLLAPLGLPIHVETDLNVPAVAEYHQGAGRGSQRMMSAVIGTGLGAAMIIDGQLLRFTHGMLGDSGHVILDPDGPTCLVGCHGCAEALVSTQGIERRAQAHLNEPAAARIRQAYQQGSSSSLSNAVIDGCQQGDPLSVQLIEETGQWLGQWLASLAPIFLPDTVVLCGGVAEAGEPLRAACEQRFLALAGPEYTHLVIKQGAFKSLAGVVGAAYPLFMESA